MRKLVLGGMAAAMVVALSACGTPGNTDEGSSDPEYPTSQITVISPFDPGGGIDLAINSVIKTLNETGLTDASMRLTNMPGGSGMVATATLAGDNDGDDDALLLTSVSTLSASLRDAANTSLREMTPLAGLYAEYTYVYVLDGSPFKKLKDIADKISADPGSVVIGGASLGSADNMVVAQLAQDLNLSFDDLAYIPLTGDENAGNLLGGQIDVAFGGPDLLDLVDSGDVRVLAVSAPERIEVERVSSIPTFIEEGYQVSQANWRGLFGPPNMPQYAVDYWNKALKEMSTTAEWKQIAQDNVWDITGLDKDEFTSFLDEEEISLKEILTNLGLVS